SVAGTDRVVDEPGKGNRDVNVLCAARTVSHGNSINATVKISERTCTEGSAIQRILISRTTSSRGGRHSNSTIGAIAGSGCNVECCLDLRIDAVDGHD